MGRTVAKSLVVPTDDWVRAYRFAGVVLKSGGTVLWAQTSLRAKTSSGRVRSFPPGTFVAPLEWRGGAANSGLLSPDQLRDEASRRGLAGTVVDGEIRGELSYLKPARVALYGDGGSPYPFADILSSIGVEYGSVTAVDVRNGELGAYDAFVIPGGGSGGPPIQGALLGDEGRLAVKEFVHRGGGLWGSCAGCCNLVHMREETLKSWKALFKDWPPMQSLEVINAEYWSVGMPGVGKLLVSNSNPAHPVMFGLPKQFELTWHLGPFLSPLSGRSREASSPTPLVRLEGFTKEWTSSEFVFSHSKQSRPGALDETYAGRGIREKRYGVVAGYYGLGKVCASGAHPEFGLDWLLEKWGGPAKMFANFVMWSVSTGSPQEPRIDAAAPRKTATTNTAASAHKMVVERCSRLRREALKLLRKSQGPIPSWLDESKAEASFGRSGSKKWNGIVRRLVDLPPQVEAASEAVLERRNALLGVLEGCREMALEVDDGSHLATLGRIEKAIESQLVCANDDYFYRRPPEWNQDYGWNGALALLDSAIGALVYSLKNYDNQEATSSNSPYHALWAWYLGGLYDAINALVVLRSRERALADCLRISELALRGIGAQSPRGVPTVARG